MFDLTIIRQIGNHQLLGVFPHGGRADYIGAMAHKFHLYSHDPIRSRLAPKLATLMQESGAASTGLAWSAAEDCGVLHPYLTLCPEAEQGCGLEGVPEEFIRNSRRESVVGRLHSGQTRANTWAGLFLAERHGRSWFLVLQGDRRLEVGRDLGRAAEIAAWVATWAVGRIEGAEPTADLSAMELIAEGEDTEDASDFASAITSYRQAHEAGLSTGNEAAVIRAGRFLARALRKLGRWDEAVGWYQQARETALALGRLDEAAYVAIGLANVRRHKGAIPEAEALYRSAIEEAGRAGARRAVAQGHFGLMLIQRDAEAWTEAVQPGWRAFREARGLPDEWDVLHALGDCFRMLGRSEEAWWCNLITMNGSPLAETRHQAAQNLAVMAALRGDEASFDVYSSQVNLAEVSVMGRGQILFERGQALLALGRPEGQGALKAALRYAEESKLGKLVFDIEAALELERPWEPLLGPDPVVRDTEAEEIRTQLELLASGV